jgi:hypothetical protein
VIFGNPWCEVPRFEEIDSNLVIVRPSLGMINAVQPVLNAGNWFWRKIEKYLWAAWPQDAKTQIHSLGNSISMSNRTCWTLFVVLQPTVLRCSGVTVWWRISSDCSDRRTATQFNSTSSWPVLRYGYHINLENDSKSMADTPNQNLGQLTYTTLLSIVIPNIN